MNRLRKYIAPQVIGFCLVYQMAACCVTHKYNNDETLYTYEGQTAICTIYRPNKAYSILIEFYTIKDFILNEILAEKNCWNFEAKIVQLFCPMYLRIFLAI